jgi:hypothetical protein
VTDFVHIKNVGLPNEKRALFLRRNMHISPYAVLNITNIITITALAHCDDVFVMRGTRFSDERQIVDFGVMFNSEYSVNFQPRIGTLDGFFLHTGVRECNRVISSGVWGTNHVGSSSILPDGQPKLKYDISYQSGGYSIFNSNDRDLDQVRNNPEKSFFVPHTDLVVLDSYLYSPRSTEGIDVFDSKVDVYSGGIVSIHNLREKKTDFYDLDLQYLSSISEDKKKSLVHDNVCQLPFLIYSQIDEIDCDRDSRVCSYRYYLIDLASATGGEINNKRDLFFFSCMFFKVDMAGVKIHRLAA